LIGFAGQRTQAFFDPQVGMVLTGDAGLVVDRHKFDYPLAAGSIERRPGVGTKRGSGARGLIAGAAFVPSLTGLGILSFPFPGTAVPGYRLFRPRSTSSGQALRDLGGVEVCALSALCALWVEVCALSALCVEVSALCALRVRFHRFFMPEVQNWSRSPTIYSRGRRPARSDLRFD
jgi:hypothetical protein